MYFMSRFFFLCPSFQGKEAKAFSESGKEADDLEYVQTDKPAVAAALGLTTKKAAAVAVIKKEADKFVEFGARSSLSSCF